MGPPFFVTRVTQTLYRVQSGELRNFRGVAHLVCLQERGQRANVYSSRLNHVPRFQRLFRLGSGSPLS
jgi:hypothetical protein